MSGNYDAPFIEDNGGGEKGRELLDPESASLETQLEALTQERTFLQPFRTSIPFVWALTEREVARLHQLILSQQPPARNASDHILHRSISVSTTKRTPLTETLAASLARSDSNAAAHAAAANSASLLKEDPRRAAAGPSSPPPPSNPMLISRSKSMSAATMPSSLGSKKRVKLPVPAERYPEYNFVGRLLGPRGATLKTLERETGCKIMIRGKGSIRKDKEDEVRGKPGWDHVFHEPLHVVIEADMVDDAVATRALNRAREAVELLLVPVPEDRDSLKRQQLRDLAILNGTFRGAMLGSGAIGASGAAAPPHLGGPASRDTSALAGSLSRTVSTNTNTAAASGGGFHRVTSSTATHDGSGCDDYLKAVGGGIPRAVSMRSTSPLPFNDASRGSSSVAVGAPGAVAVNKTAAAGANLTVAPPSSSTIWGAAAAPATGSNSQGPASSRPIGSPIKPGFALSKSTTALVEARQLSQSPPPPAVPASAAAGGREASQPKIGEYAGSFGLSSELYRGAFSNGSSVDGGAGGAEVRQSSDPSKDAYDPDLGSIRLVYSNDQRNFGEPPPPSSSVTSQPQPPPQSSAAPRNTSSPAGSSNIIGGGGGSVGNGDNITNMSNPNSTAASASATTTTTTTTSTVTFGPASAILP
mmetsp:Transcript_16064/g.34801  ORF Transcript_16064/g.34801 Transcript_16064/m.34801 type:complete len:644 (+) Transcript_16064:358-2289(+)